LKALEPKDVIVSFSTTSSSLSELGSPVGGYWPIGAVH
jgi:hypothetical protein